MTIPNFFLAHSSYSAWSGAKQIRILKALTYLSALRSNLPVSESFLIFLLRQPPSLPVVFSFDFSHFQTLKITNYKNKKFPLPAVYSYLNHSIWLPFEISVAAEIHAKSDSLLSFFHSIRPVVSFWHCYSSPTTVKLFFLKFRKFTLSCSSFIMKLTLRLRNLNWSLSFCTLNKCWSSLVDISLTCSRCYSWLESPLE